jgi:3',5'-cyclic AMP phosphodiesterase CpdA
VFRILAISLWSGEKIKVKIVCISDTHGMHSKIGKLPDGDMLIHAGDFTVDFPPINEIDDLIFFNRWLEKQPYRYKILIAGNHDFIFQKDYSTAKETICNVEDCGWQSVTSVLISQ